MAVELFVTDVVHIILISSKLNIILRTHAFNWKNVKIVENRFRIYGRSNLQCVKSKQQL